LLAGFAKMPAIFTPDSTPAYSNDGYSLVGMVIENITGIPLDESFNESLVAALNLTRAFYGVPDDPSYGAIPEKVAWSGWYQDLGPANA
jgi:CubicO group peptidase (beta-lactamase class C family)